MRYPFDRRKRSRRRFRAAVAHRRRDGKILYRAVPRRGGRVVDGSGLEIRIQDFGLNWTGFATSVLVFGNSIVRVLCEWTDVTPNAPNFLVRVTF